LWDEIEASGLKSQRGEAELSALRPSHHQPPEFPFAHTCLSSIRPETRVTQLIILHSSTCLVGYPALFVARITAGLMSTRCRHRVEEVASSRWLATLIGAAIGIHHARISSRFPVFVLSAACACTAL